MELNGYVCFWRGKRVEVRAGTSLEARNKAATLFKARKGYEVTVVLAERGTVPVAHDGASLPGA